MNALAARTQALSTLQGYLGGAVSLDGLIEWAQILEATGSDDVWLARLATDLANPLLCREQATALVFESLRTSASDRPATPGPASPPPRRP